MGGARDKARDAAIISAMSQIRTKAELINAADDSYANLDDANTPCSSIDGEMTALCNEINSSYTGGSFGDANFEADATHYCVFTALNVEYGGGTDYYCVDSTGVAGQTTTDPGQAGNCDGVDFAVMCPAVR